MFTNKKMQGLVAVIWFIATILVIYLFRLPPSVTEIVNENNITQETVFSFKADIEPYALHPQGGIINVERAVFTKITREIIVNIHISIRSDKPVEVNGSKTVTLNLVAGDLWQKDFVLEPKSNFQMNGTMHTVMDSDYRIHLKELTNFMQAVNESINILPGKHTLEIKPEIEGTITFGDEVIPINLKAIAPLDYSTSQISIADENTFSVTTPIFSTFITQSKFDILGFEVSLHLAKIISAILYLSICVLIIVVLHPIIKRSLAPSRSQRIDKKYRARLVNIIKDTSTSIYKIPNIHMLDSFHSLLKISDEKEALIFTYADDEKTDYYIIDNGFVFVYQSVVQSAKG